MASKESAERHNESGEEVLDTTVRYVPLQKKTPSLHEQIQQAVRYERLRALENRGIEETDEEADDFEIGEDFEPLSKHENDHIPSIKALKKRAKEINAKIEEAKRKKAIADHEAALSRDRRPPSHIDPADRKPVVNPGADPHPDDGSE